MLTATAVVEARRQMEDSAFGREGLQMAVARLRHYCDNKHDEHGRKLRRYAE